MHIESFRLEKLKKVKMANVTEKNKRMAGEANEPITHAHVFGLHGVENTKL